MRHANKIFIFAAMVLLVVLGSQTMPVRPPATAYRSPIFTSQSEETVLPLVESTTTTTEPIVEVTTTIPEVTTTIPEVITTIFVKPTVTTQVVIRTTTTEPYIASVKTVESDGPPHNTTTLVGCISYYESGWGEDPNVFQFTQGTWETYGGTGSPSNASYSTQEFIFWLAWEDDGHHHWAAQKGRCF